MNLLPWALVWLSGAIVLLARHWRPGAGVGLLLAYVLSFAALHFLPSLVYLLPWYGGPAGELTTAGLRESAIAMVGLTLGAELALRLRRDRRLVPAARPAPRPVDPAMANSYLVVGLLLYIVVAPYASWIPTIGTLVSMGATLAVAGLGLKYWNARTAGDRRWAAIWLLAAGLFPIMTVLGQGFLGFGFAASLCVVVFAVSWSRLRWLQVCAGFLVGYLGLSVYVTYMRDRTEIRDVVWSAGTLERRVERLLHTASRPEWFNLFHVEHLQRVDQRLNQNFLVGSAVDYLDNRFAQFANGETFAAAIVAPIPRALWPEKPVVAGGAELVSRYTGYRFHGTTSVGIGQVMEWYVNFGRWGVMLGFIAIGVVIVAVDRVAASALMAGDARRFLMWYVPGLALIQVGGSFSELTGTAAASFLVAGLLNAATVLWISRRPQAATSTADLETEPVP
jgi:hypothetical protein